MAFRRLTKEQMVELLRELRERGWIESLRPLNSGGIGNTIDALLGFPENNLPIADTAQWELKSHRMGKSTLLTLFSIEPEPRDMHVVPAILLPNYGWPRRTGTSGEMSFRQTLRATHPTDRGFGITLDRQGERVIVYFDVAEVAPRHNVWLRSVEERIGLGPLQPQVYWRLRDLLLKASTKMLNTFYVDAETRRQGDDEYFRISSVQVLQGFESDRFLLAIEAGDALVEFDARTGKNHGAKFRLKRSALSGLYRYAERAL